MSTRPSLLWLSASVVAHGGLLALLFFVFVSDESFSNPLIIDLSSLETTTESVSKPGPRAERPAVGPRGGSKGAGAEKPVERIAAAPAPPAPASPAPIVTPEPAPAPEPARPPEPAPVVAATPEPVAPREPAQSAAPSTTPSPVAGTNPAATGGSSADGAAGRGATSDGASGGSGSRVALATGGGGEQGSEYGGYLAGVRRRIQDSLQYPTSARRRGIKGTVNLEILIRADGAISSVSVARSSSHSELDDAAVEAVRSLARQPFPAGLRPRPLRVTLPIVFDLQ